jgi:hypothetical protein
MTVEDSFLEYLDAGFETIEGWPGRKESVRFLKIFRELFGQHNDMGGVCEIGVHHGKYLIALHNLLGGNKRSVGLDLFADQSRNVDGSGRGSMDICRANIDKYARNPHLIDLVGCDSLTLRGQQVRELQDKYGLFSIFSIDGGHTALHLVRDFLFASECVSENGIIAVDDIFHFQWPGVTEGFYNVLAAGTSPFVPFFMTRKKIFCCSASVQATYREFVGEHAGNIRKRVEFCGWQMFSLNFGDEY